MLFRSYVIIQLLASVVASFAVWIVAGGNAAAAHTVLQGVPDFGPHMPIIAVLAEIIATFFLVFVIFGSAADPRAHKTGGIAIGLAVTADILAVGPISGASMNPSRNFGCTLVASLLEGGGNLWVRHWVYWVGPVVGAVLAAWVYHAALWPRDPKRGTEASAEDVPVTQRA